MVQASAITTSATLTLPQSAKRVKQENLIARQEAERKRLEVSAETKRKREECIHLLCQPEPLSQSAIARRVGVTQKTVSVYAKQLLEKGIEAAYKDGRMSNGRKTNYEKAYKLIEDHKKANLGLGGRELWAWLADTVALPLDEIPCQASIDRFCSEKKLTNPLLKNNRNAGYWLNDKVETFLDRVGMDEVFPFHLATGQRFKVLDIRDNFSGITYAEPFAYDYRAHDQRGIDDLTFASVFVQFVNHVGRPKVLVLDNGGQTIDSGWLPEIARHAIEQGTVIDWEPFGTPTENSHVERWHREIQKRWLNDGGKIYRMEDGFEWTRKQAWRESAVYPRWNLGQRPAAERFPIRQWDFKERTLPELAAVGRGGNTRGGCVRMHRRVETHGLTQLHGGEYIILSPALAGAKVRIDFHVLPGGQGGQGTVITAHGEVVATFEHRIEQGVKQGQRLIYNVERYAYDGGEDARPDSFSQEAYDAAMIRFHKNNRSSRYMATMEKLNAGEEISQ